MTVVDTILRGGQVIHVQTRTVEQHDVGILNDKIVLNPTDATSIIDVAGSFISPGFIDAHMHVESTMLIPTSFAKLSLPHGTTSAIFDPHEIANVLGIEGIKLLLHDADNMPFDSFFAASSCVPASPLETSGTTLLADDLDWSNGFYSIIDQQKLFPMIITDNGKSGLLARTAVVRLDHPFRNKEDIVG